MLTNYKVENMVIMNMKKHSSFSRTKYEIESRIKYEVEDTLTIDEKIEFIDEIKHGIGSYLLELIEKWELENESLPHDSHGRPKTVSKKAWLKRNDNEEVIDRDFKIGSYYLFGTSYDDIFLNCSNSEYTHIVHKWFHDLLCELERNEIKHFKNNDSFHIKLKQVRELTDIYGNVFNNEKLNNIRWNTHKIQDVTEKDLDIFIHAYDLLKDAISKIKLD